MNSASGHITNLHSTIHRTTQQAAKMVTEDLQTEELLAQVAAVTTTCPAMGHSPTNLKLAGKGPPPHHTGANPFPLTEIAIVESRSVQHCPIFKSFAISKGSNNPFHVSKTFVCPFTNRAQTVSVRLTVSFQTS